MLRILLLGGAFVGISAALVIFQPGADRLKSVSGSQTIPEDVVTRAPVRLETETAGTSGSAPAALAAPVEPAPNQEALTNAVANALRNSISVPSERRTEPAAGSDAVSALTAAVLRAQAASTDAGPPVDGAAGQNDELIALSQSVLAQLTGATGARAQETPTLDVAIAQALRHGQSDAYLDELLNEARDSGQIAIPSGMIRSDGSVDTATLLTALVEQSVAANSALLNGPSEAKSPAVARITRTSPETYTVQAGDSLAAISVRFYGTTSDYMEIFRANQDQLSSPDRIRIGQRLTIPAL